jgi:Ca2+-binding EF-hand superfamily protein
MKPIILFLSIMILSLSGGLAHGMAQVRQNEDNVDMMMKYQDMDRNNDGKITREEWQRFFNNHDWNGDGVLSGDELRSGASRQSASSDQFRALDRNNSGAISRSEWIGTTQDFNRLDQDRNGHLSVNEFYQSPGLYQFSELDYNNDGVITYEEWSPNSRRSFEVLDLNRDGKLTRDEFYNSQQYTVSVFRELDQNNDGRISRSEWRSTSDAFNRLDTNGDNLLSEDEFNTPQSNSIAVQILQEIFKKR